ncbi:hypothetical protein [Streptomyces atratus]|uniref:hypothetical protein n=1 Tax=Streptomyces atratus TaxID=1893 RepID=UPI0033D1C8DB
MHTHRIGKAAALMSVSAGTLRRWADCGKPHAERDELDRRMIPGPELASFVRELHRTEQTNSGSSARNRRSGIVTEGPSERSRRRGRSGPGRTGWCP